MARDIASSIGILIFKPSAYHNREIREIAMSGLKKFLSLTSDIIILLVDNVFYILALLLNLVSHQNT